MVERIDQKRVSSRGGSGESGQQLNSNVEQSADEGKVKLQSMKLTQFFSKKGGSQQQQQSKSLAPAKQRAIPIIKQAQPRVVMSSQEDDDDNDEGDVNGGKGSQCKGSDHEMTATTAGDKKDCMPILSTEMATDEKNHSSPDDQHHSRGPSREPSNKDEEKAAVAREDAIDISLRDHLDEVKDDAATNPVEQANKKRARTAVDQGAFLANDTATTAPSTAAKTFQDEQIALYREQNGGSSSGKLIDESAQNNAESVIEQASDDSDIEDQDQDQEYLPARRRNRLINDSAYTEDAAENAEESEEAPLDDLEPENIQEQFEEKKEKKPKEKSVTRRHRTEVDEANLMGDEQEETVFIDNLPNDEQGIKSMLGEVRRNIITLEKQFLMEEDSDAEEDEKLLKSFQFDANLQNDEEQQIVKRVEEERQFYCVPLQADVMTYDFPKLGEKQMEHGGRLFDIICMDPPWQLSTANPTRGVAIAYSTLTDEKIKHLPLKHVQSDGFLFIWVINARYKFALDMFEMHGYKLIDEIVWVKQTVNGKINKGHGYYLQHAKETCLIGYKGDLGDRIKGSIDSDVIFSMRRGQSQKPEEIYDICEALVPQGYFLEIFGRRNNLHDGWCTIGNEL